MNEHKQPTGIRELESIIIKAGTRVYYVDAKMDSQGSKYIALSEVKSTGKGNARERQRIHIYQEDFAKIFSALGRALETLGYDLHQGFDSAVEPHTDPTAQECISSVQMPSLDKITIELESLGTDTSETNA